MHKWFFFLFLGCVFLTHRGAAQPVTATARPSLLEFQGRYEYLSHTTLELVASPRDGLLYAIIAGSRYPLYPIGPDAFRNASQDTVRFQRDAKGSVISYSAGHQRFHLLARHVQFPTQMWYPRPVEAAHSFTYRYTAPPKTADGLPVGTLAGTGLNPNLLAKMVTKIVDGTYPNVHSVLIIKDGKLVFEEYFYEYDRESLHPLRSATKSIVSALTGLAVAQGVIPNVQAPVVGFFPEYALQHPSPLKQAITVQDLLTNQSGLDYDITDPKAAGSEEAMDNSPDWVKYTLDLPMREAPGTVGRYNSGNPITLGRLVEKQAHQPLPEFARQHLFGPLGITRFNWRFQPDSSSAETFCQVSLRSRDMAKFGLLYLDQGRWQGRQVVPTNWVTASLTKHSVVQNVDYGYLWWLKYLDANGTRYHGAMAQGNGGQRISVWPQQHLVVVVTGGNYNQQSPSDELIAKYILAAFNQN
jgi:CubicO group peptidase (beta-lactamase class C family)